MRIRHRRMLHLALAVLPACVTPPLASAPSTTSCATPIEFTQNVRNKVDILFLVDNSKSMEAMSAELRARFPQFLAPFKALAAEGTYADLQIGVVTSDYGAGTSGSGCQPSPGGQQGRLQALGQFAAPSCQPPQGARFIRYAFGPDGKAVGNLPPGQDLDQTFTCMAAVGTSGCGFEHPLESVYAALHNNLPENAGFVRADALLAVVFLTNEDDCSAPPDTDLFDRQKVAEYGYNASFRCTRFGLVCGTPGMSVPYGDSGGPLANCRPAPNGKLFDVQRYIDLFTRPAAQGGLKVDPRDVILVGIDAPSDPVMVTLQTPAGQVGSCQSLPPWDTECIPTLQHSCQNNSQPGFFGDPAVRLNAVISAAPVHRIASICDSDYTGTMKDVAALIVSQLKPGCIPVTLDDPTRPDCVVEDATLLPSGSLLVSPVPRCEAPDAIAPCWSLEARADCAKRSPQSVGITIHRGGQPAPPNTTARVSCGSTC
ncbi:MAG: hypothetical protein EXR72_05305 [Myxococcales bacterium]|nr:hypothetical protein [Myxococcales bacterium]